MPVSAFICLASAGGGHRCAPRLVADGASQRQWASAVVVVGLHALGLTLLANVKPTPASAPPPPIVQAQLIPVAAPASAPAQANSRPSELAPRPLRRPAAAPAITAPPPADEPQRVPPEALSPPAPAAAATEAGTPTDSAPPPRPGSAGSASHGLAAAATEAAASPPPAAAPPARIEWPSAQAAYLNNPPPAYPALSRRLGEQGRVVLRVRIEVDGTASAAEVRTSSGYERLDRAALEAVLRWRYVPGKRNGVPEAMWFLVPIQFVLD